MKAAANTGQGRDEGRCNGPHACFVGDCTA
jgi:hypothetical protein